RENNSERSKRIAHGFALPQADVSVRDSAPSRSSRCSEAEKTRRHGQRPTFELAAFDSMLPQPDEFSTECRYACGIFAAGTSDPSRPAKQKQRLRVAERARLQIHAPLTARHTRSLGHRSRP